MINISVIISSLMLIAVSCSSVPDKLNTYLNEHKLPTNSNLCSGKKASSVIKAYVISSTNSPKGLPLEKANEIVKKKFAILIETIVNKALL